jgi:hypothetical protein
LSNVLGRSGDKGYGVGNIPLKREEMLKEFEEWSFKAYLVIWE